MAARGSRLEPPVCSLTRTIRARTMRSDQAFSRLSRYGAATGQNDLRRLLWASQTHLGSKFTDSWLRCSGKCLNRSKCDCALAKPRIRVALLDRNLILVVLPSREKMRLSKWGNSCGVRLPANTLECAGLRIGDEVLVRVLDSGDILVKPVKRHPSATASLEAETRRTKSGAAERW